MASSADEDDNLKVDYEDDSHEENGHERNQVDEDELLLDGDTEMGSPEKNPATSSTSSDPAKPSGGDNFETLEAIKARVREMEEEAQRLREMQNEVIGQSAAASALQQQSPQHMSVEEKVELDSRSVYVGNVDYGATAEELEQHFHGCGSVNRVTILCNKFDGHPKGFAYVEFADPESVNTAMAMDESLFRGRLIKVMPKRTNRPGMSERGFGRGRGFRGYPRGGRGFRGYSRFPRRGYRGRASYYSPY